MLFQAICRTGIFMICAQAIVHFRPQESYEKYLKLLVSAMVLIQLFWPIANLFAGGDAQDAAEQLKGFQDRLEAAMEEAEAAAADSVKMLEQMTLEEVQKRMEEQEADAAWGEEVPQHTQAGQEKETIQEEADAAMRGMEAQEAETPQQGITVEVEPVEPVQIKVE